MLGVEISAIDRGTLRISCLSRRHRPNTPERMAVIANLEPFVQWLNANGNVEAQRGDAPGRTLRLPPGSMKQRLQPLWTYLRMYMTMLQLYLFQRHPPDKSAPRPGIDMQPTREAEWPQRWVQLQIPVPVGATVGFEVVNHTIQSQGELSSERREKKRRRILEEGPGPSLHFRFFWKATGEEVQEVLKRFEKHFERYLTQRTIADGEMVPDWEKLRTSRLHPILELLAAPKLWMLREAAFLLPPMCRAVAKHRNGHAEGSLSEWQPLVEQFALKPEDKSQESGTAQKAKAPRYELHVVLAKAKARKSEAPRHICLQTTLERSQEGWDTVMVDKKTLEEWLQSRQPGGKSVESMKKWTHAASLRSPYSLKTLLPLLLDILSFPEINHFYEIM
eukprot:symbB.v1.2.001541.t1/scaffold85.1/size341090/1